MELCNMVRRDREALRESPEGRAVLRSALEALVLLLAPLAPHTAEELWRRSGHNAILARTPWPAYDPALAREEVAAVVVQVNGKIRERFEAPMDLPEKELEARALGLPRVVAALGGKSPRKVIAVRNKLVNIVV
jgi:leucyl-tRNA synthetase